MGSPFIAAVERWRAYAKAVGDLTRYQIPQGWILAIIENESAGVAGIPGKTGEAGLMQVQRGLVDFYNQETGSTFTWEDMKGTDDDAAKKQIIVGTLYLSQCRDDVAPMVPPAAGLSTAQAYFADLAYGSGLGALRRHRKATKAAGLPDTFEGMETLAKRGGGTIPARKFGHARRVVSLLKKDGLAQGYDPAIYPRKVGSATPGPGPGPDPGPSPDPGGGGGGAAGGFAIIAIVGLLAFGLFAKEKKQKRATEAGPVYYGYYGTP